MKVPSFQPLEQRSRRAYQLRRFQNQARGHSSRSWTKIRGEREGLRPMSREVSLCDQISGTSQDRSRYPQTFQVCHVRENVSAAVHAERPRKKVAHSENDALRSMQFHGCERHRRGETHETTPSRSEVHLRDLQRELRGQGFLDDSHDYAQLYAVSSVQRLRYYVRRRVQPEGAQPSVPLRSDDVDPGEAGGGRAAAGHRDGAQMRRVWQGLQVQVRVEATQSESARRRAELREASLSVRTLRQGAKNRERPGNSQPVAHR